MNEFDEFEDPIEPVAPVKIDYKAKDMELYNKWKTTNSRRDLSNLVNHLSPLMYREVARASGTLPVSALNTEAKNWTIKAIENYNPNKGVALSTHVTGYLQRVRRLNYKYQHVARMPENLKREFHKWNTAVTHLSDELNRDPTEEEIAKRLGWSKGAVIKYKKHVYSDLIEGSEDKPTEVERYSNTNLLMNSLMAQLSPDEKFILQNKGTMPATQLAEKLGVNTNRLNYLQNKLVDKIQKLKMELGI